jgi:hypothetical protein
VPRNSAGHFIPACVMQILLIRHPIHVQLDLHTASHRQLPQLVASSSHLLQPASWTRTPVAAFSYAPSHLCFITTGQIDHRV